jgi:hypothetical protein
MGGTLGGGIQIDSRVTPNLGVRISKGHIGHSGSFEADGADFDVSGELDSTTALLDYYPNQGAFRVSGGMTLFDFNMTAKSSYDLNDEPGYVPAPGDDGMRTATTDVDYTKYAPAASIGWSGTVFDKAYVSFDVGALYMKKADIRVEGTNNADFGDATNARLANDREKLADALADLNIYPTMQVAVGYTF